LPNNNKAKWLNKINQKFLGLQVIYLELDGIWKVGSAIIIKASVLLKISYTE